MRLLSVSNREKQTPKESIFKSKPFLGCSELEKAVHLVAAELHCLREDLKSGLDWFKSQANLVTKQDLKEMEKRIMATQAEVVEELKLLKEQGAKIKAEVISAKEELTAEIKRLQDIIDSGSAGEATPELVQIKDELKETLQGIDDLHLDTPAPARR